MVHLTVDDWQIQRKTSLFHLVGASRPPEQAPRITRTLLWSPNMVHHGEALMRLQLLHGAFHCFQIRRTTYTVSGRRTFLSSRYDNLTPWQESSASVTLRTRFHQGIAPAMLIITSLCIHGSSTGYLFVIGWLDIAWAAQLFHARAET